MGMTDEDRRALKGSGQAERLLASVNETGAILAISRAEVYRRIASGDLKAAKIGVKTVVTMASIAAFADGLPPANIRSTARTAA